ncbi:hypothetical protein [Bartonella raoultii]|uniref:Uncharacterized protein n=1 Tax=Bartonella raoultii TaxID=1457020 RepID=A0ABS7I8E1_9HYPH|nr:hypothetical protein [Bartonella raoultii]MBX4336491.1 hypothetical protein [Bartonella raoultii]
MSFVEALKILFLIFSGSGFTLSFVSLFYVFYQRIKLHRSLSLELKNSLMPQGKRGKRGKSEGKPQCSVLEKKENLRSFEQITSSLYKNKKVWIFSILFGVLQAFSLTITKGWDVGRLESWSHGVKYFIVLFPSCISVFVLLFSPIVLVVHFIIMSRVEKIIPLLEEKLKEKNEPVVL